MGSWRSLVLSLMAVAAVVALWVALMPRPEQAPQRAAVDATAVARAVAREAKVTVVLPDLGQGWRPTSVDHAISPPSLSVGYHRLPDLDAYLTFDEVWSVPADPALATNWLAAKLGSARAQGVRLVEGEQWESFSLGGTPAKHALVRRGSGTERPVLMLTGAMTLEQLGEAAAGVAPVSGQ